MSNSTWDAYGKAPNDSGWCGIIGSLVEWSSQPIPDFAHLASLPDDMSEAFESFKLSILRRKLSGWSDISRPDLIAALEALKQLALAPSD